MEKTDSERILQSIEFHKMRADYWLTQFNNTKFNEYLELHRPWEGQRTAQRLCEYHMTCMAELKVRLTLLNQTKSI